MHPTVATTKTQRLESSPSKRPDDSTVVAVEDLRRLRRVLRMRCLRVPLCLCASAFNCDVFVTWWLRRPSPRDPDHDPAARTIAQHETAPESRRILLP